MHLYDPYLFYTLLISCMGVFSARRDVGIVVNGPNWHFEVAFWAAYTLKSIGLEVHSFINTGSGPVGDYSNNEIYKFMKSCSDRIVVLPATPDLAGESMGNYSNVLDAYHNRSRDSVRIKSSVKILIYITLDNDQMIMKALGWQDTLQTDIAEHSVWIAHAGQRAEVSTVCSKIKNCTLAFLADHVRDSALSYTLNSWPNIRTKSDITSLYPVYKYPHIPSQDDFYHSEYKEKSIVPSRKSVVLQGSTNRREFNTIFACMKNLREHKKLDFDLKVVGSGADGLNRRIDDSLIPFVHTYSDLSNQDFYSTVANSTFLATFMHNTAFYVYNESVASSSVAVGLSTGLPIVTNAHFLHKYPCLRSAKMHQRVAKKTDCDSIAAALLLSAAEYHVLKREAILCRDYLFQESRMKLTGIIHSSAGV